MKLLQEDDYFILQESGEYLLSEDLYDYSFPVSVGVFSLSGISTGLYKHLKVIVEVGAFTFTGISARLFRGFTILCETVGFTLTGITNSLIKISKIPAETGIFSLKLKYLETYFSKGIWRLKRKTQTVYDSLAKVSTVYSKRLPVSTTYEKRASVSTMWCGKNDVGYDILQEDEYLILQEDGYKIKFPVNIWTNTPKS